MNIQDIAEWMKPIIQYLEHGTLPEEKLQAQKLIVKAAHYSIHNGELYRRSLSHPWSKCVSPEEGDYVLREIHEGICGAHEAQDTLVRKALLQGYYWPSMMKDALQLVQKCSKCQLFARVTHHPSNIQHPIRSPWPFVIWGMDILGHSQFPQPRRSC